jgi:2-polyprenylphenol hydroxylase and related flavodoxin oxidoreductases
MYKIIKKRLLAEAVYEYVIEAPDAVRRAKAGQFVVIRTDEDGERIPLTICDFDRAAGTITLLVQTVGYTTYRLSQIPEGSYISDLAGPLGNPTDFGNAENILLVGGGIGTAVIYAQAKELFSRGKRPDIIVGARDKSLLVYVPELEKLGNLFIMTDNGTAGGKGFVTDRLKELLDCGKIYDAALAVGPLKMMRAVSLVTIPRGIHTVVSMNSIMVDGTGMCGSCRLSVGGKIKYACVDGPEFDAGLIDFDEALRRAAIYVEEEKEAYCRLKAYGIRHKENGIN